MTIADSTPSLIDAPAWSIRPETPLDLDQIHHLHRDAFGRPDEAEVVDAVRAGAGFFPEGSLVAVADDGSVLGHVLLSRVSYQPDGDTERLEVLALAPLATLPPHAGRGIGSALVAAALDVADARDEPFVVVLGPPSFYAPLGFVPAADHGVSGPYDGAPSAFQVRPRGGSGAIPGGTVSYPAIFEGLRAT
jgi:putative acetyltransferase